MHSQQGVDAYLQAIEEAKKSGGTIEYGGKVWEIVFFFHIELR